MITLEYLSQIKASPAPVSTAYGMQTDPTDLISIHRKNCFLIHALHVVIVRHLNGL